MVHSPARTTAATAVPCRVLARRVPAHRAVRRLLAHRAVRRLLVLAGLVVAGWLIGGTAQAFADTAVPAVAGPAHPALLPAGGTPRGIVRDTSAALGERAPVPTAFAAMPRGGALVPLPGHPVLNVPVPRPSGPPDARGGQTTPGGPVAEGGAPVTSRPNAGVSPDRPVRTVRKGARAARIITHRAGRASAGHAGRNVARTVRRAPHAPVAPAPAPAPAQAGSLAPVPGPVLFGGFGGVFLRRVWTPRRPKAVLVRAAGEAPPAVRGAAGEPAVAPD
ncbi:hypothetical protein [Actinomadura rupiterrae]|uniref:hypothetical protein n=1 Tax=Actinomadura rupiterrae TaxID=559627 RepID=UPI0020A394DD|nr:hypothetical protein [Actinomadura rupiterrae]MCP2342928.1 hypothetical protein [Actinomadura rupiterrae]